MLCQRRLWRRLNGTCSISSLVRLERLSTIHRNPHSATSISTWTSLRLCSIICQHPKKRAHRPTNTSQVKRNEVTPTQNGPRNWQERATRLDRHLGCWLSLALQLLGTELSWVRFRAGYSLGLLNAPSSFCDWRRPFHRLAFSWRCRRHRHPPSLRQSARA